MALYGDPGTLTKEGRCFALRARLKCLLGNNPAGKAELQTNMPHLPSKGKNLPGATNGFTDPFLGPLPGFHLFTGENTVDALGYRDC